MKNNDKAHQDKNPICANHHQNATIPSFGQIIKEFKPTVQPFFPSHSKQPADLVSNSSFSVAGIPTFSESLTLNDGKTAQGNEVSNWRTSAPEFIPKGLNQLTAQGQLPSQLSQLPLKSTAETAFLKLTFGHHNNGIAAQS